VSKDFNVTMSLTCRVSPDTEVRISKSCFS